MELVAALIFGVIIFGFTALDAGSAVLRMADVRRVSRAARAAAGAPEPPAVEPEPPPEVEDGAGASQGDGRRPAPPASLSCAADGRR